VTFGFAVGAAIVLVGVAFVEFVAAVADEDVLLGSSDGFSPPEHPAAKIVKQTENVIRMALSIPEKQRRAFFICDTCLKR
jgi:hypothetical protein